MAHRTSNIGIYPTRSDWDDTRHFGYRNRDHFSGAPSDKERFEKGYGYDETTRPTRDFAGVGPKNYRRSDQSIRDEVCDRLTLHPRVDPSEIEVQVKDGIVTLLGTVSDRESKRMAEDTARNRRAKKSFFRGKIALLLAHRRSKNRSHFLNQRFDFC